MYQIPLNPPNKYEMATLIDEKMEYGQVNLCLVHETRNYISTTLQINGPNSKAIIPFILIACLFIVLNIFVLLCMLFVFIFPINLHKNPKSKAHTYPHDIYHSLLPSIYNLIFSYSNFLPQMLPIHRKSLMFPSHNLFSYNKPKPTLSPNHISTDSPAPHPPNSPAPFKDISKLDVITPFVIFIWLLSSIDVYLFLFPTKLRCLEYVIGKTLLKTLSCRFIYMHNTSIIALNHTTLDILFTHVYRCHATTLYFGLPINTPHLYYLNPATNICLIKLYAVLIFRFTWLLYRYIKLPQFALKADVYLLRYTLLEKSPLSFTFYLLSKLSVQAYWINILYLGHAEFVQSLFCYFLNINRNRPMIPMISNIVMNLRYTTCQNTIFYSVQTLTFITIVLYICIVVRLHDLYTHYRIYPFIHSVWILLNWYTLTDFVFLTAFIKYLLEVSIQYLYCIYMYIYGCDIYNHHHHHHHHHHQQQQQQQQLPSRTHPLNITFQLLIYPLQKYEHFANVSDQDQARLIVGPDQGLKHVHYYNYHYKYYSFIVTYTYYIYYCSYETERIYTCFAFKLIQDHGFEHF